MIDKDIIKDIKRRISEIAKNNPKSIDIERKLKELYIKSNTITKQVCIDAIAYLIVYRSLNVNYKLV